MLEKSKFVVKTQKKMLSSKKTYDIVDAETGDVLASTASKKGLMGMLLGMVGGGGKDTIIVKQVSNQKPVLTVRRKGLIFKKIQVLNGAGKVIGRYKAKAFSLSGGFHVYDANGKHFAEVTGKMFKSDYKFISPDGGAEIGAVSKSGVGGMKALLTSAGAYGVQIAPKYADDVNAKILVLGAAIAIDSMFKKGGGHSEAGGGDEE